MRKKKLLAFYEENNLMYLQKENILKPLVLSILKNLECDFYYAYNNGTVPIPPEYRGLRFHETGGRKWKLFIVVLFKIIKYRKNIDVLFTFHGGSIDVIILTYVYKFFNRNGSIWISADIEFDSTKLLVDNKFVFGNGIKRLLKKPIIYGYYKRLSVYSVETTKCYDYFFPFFKIQGWKCLTYLPCGIDEELMSDVDRNQPKKNIILSVGRFGSYQKNTEMLLEGLAKVDLKDWMVYLVGPITSDFSISNDDHPFKKYIEAYYSQHPSLREKILFTGPEFDSNKLNSYFRDAKIFVMTSRHEAFANVFSQARWYRCHIMSTDVGGAPDMSKNWEYGTCINQDDPQDLANKLQSLLKGDISYPSEEFAKQISYQNLINTKLKVLLK